MEIGQSMFTAEEIAEESKRKEEQKKAFEEKMAKGFFQDGNTRKVVITDIQKESKVSQRGNAYVLHSYIFEDVDTGERESVTDYNFALTNALDPIKSELGTNLRIGTTVLSLTTTQAGEREYNGVNYPVWSHEMYVVSNPDATAKKAETSEAPF